MNFLIPIISGILFRCGGIDQWKWCILNQKCWRWFMGVIVGLFVWHGWIWYGICILSYFLATNLFGYGDKTPILKYLPQRIKHLVSGMIYGLATVSVFYWIFGWWALLQIVVCGATFYCIERFNVQNPWAEVLRGGS